MIISDEPRRSQRTPNRLLLLFWLISKGDAVVYVKPDACFQASASSQLQLRRTSVARADFFSAGLDLIFPVLCRKLNVKGSAKQISVKMPLC